VFSGVKRLNAARSAGVRFGHRGFAPFMAGRLHLYESCDLHPSFHIPFTSAFPGLRREPL